MVTDYDCWRENEDNVGVKEIVKTLLENADKAKSLIKAFVEEFKINRPNYIIDGVDNVLDSAIITSNVTNPNFIEAGLDIIAKRIIDANK
jgi:5'-methylthioadenosine phosphorylase